MGADDELMDIARRVDRILKEELQKVGIGHDMAAARMYDIKTVGVQGDKRSYCYPAEIELRQEKNFVWDPEFLAQLSTRITNQVEEVNRVVYVISPA